MLLRSFQILAFATTFIGAAHANLLVNGDFSAGYSGFSNNYSQVATNGTVYTAPGDYAVIYNPGTAFTNGYAHYGDHTSGTGQMLFIDGAYTPQNAWSESLSLGPGKYTFTGWEANAGPQSPAVLDFLVDGSAVGSTFTNSYSPGTWQQWSTQFTLASSTTITLAVQDTNLQGVGNDFTIDDLALTPLSSTTPEPSSLLLAGSGLLAAAGMVRRKLQGKAAR